MSRFCGNRPNLLTRNTPSFGLESEIVANQEELRDFLGTDPPGSCRNNQVEWLVCGFQEADVEQIDPEPSR